MLGVDPGDVERFRLAADLEPAALADGIVDHPAMRAQHRAGLGMDDIARRLALGPHRAHHFGIVAIGHEADVLAVGLGRDAQAGGFGEAADLALGQAAQREAQEVELGFGGGVEEIALVARRIDGTVELAARRAFDPAHVVAGRQAVGAEFAGHRQEVGELGPHVAADAGDRRAPGEIVVGKALDHVLAEARLVVDHVVRDAEPVGDRARVANVVAGAAGALAAGGGAIIVELQRHADHLGAAGGGERGDHRAVDPARHGDHDPAADRRSGKLKQRPGVEAGGEQRGGCAHRAAHTRGRAGILPERTGREGDAG